VKSDAWPIARWGGYALTLLYAMYYFGDETAPGNSLESPAGWWGWWDQSQYIASARNLLAGNLVPDAHWYPLGYSLAAAPFVRIWPAHGFFFLDLICLLAAYAGFLSFTRRVGVGPLAAVPIFLLTTFAYPSIGETWAQPWTSSLNAALIWLLLSSAASLLAGRDAWHARRLVLFGLLAGSIPLVRPVDAVLSAIVVLCVLFQGLRTGGLRARHLGWIGLGGALVILPFGALYLRIYGMHATPYVLHEQTIGFAFSRLGWKTYLLLIEPRPWYPGTFGLLATFPWFVLSLAELVLLVMQRHRQVALILMGLLIIVHWSLYFAYVDLSPSNIWLYHLVHYLKWTLPGLGIFAWLFVLRFSRSPRWRYGLLLAVIIGILSIRIVPVRAAPDDEVEMIQYSAPPMDWDETHMHDWPFSDARGEMGLLGIRVMSDLQGIRLLPQRRSIVGVLEWPGAPVALNKPPVRWTARVAVGYPCWLPPYPCRRLPPRL
jgi:hypothetical protein